MPKGVGSLNDAAREPVTSPPLCMARLLPMQDARMLQVARSEMIAKRVCFIFCMIEPWGFSFLIYL